ncbi:hypothetical protein ACTI_22010 [Actinoplanes sp. OR16]|nr:hypothetical protein ACTI_22010 [Actinoplanes sp. OR16]
MIGLHEPDRGLLPGQRLHRGLGGIGRHRDTEHTDALDDARLTRRDTEPIQQRVSVGVRDKTDIDSYGRSGRGIRGSGDHGAEQRGSQGYGRGPHLRDQVRVVV